MKKMAPRIFVNLAQKVLLSFCIFSTFPLTAQWIARGPGPSTNGGVENIADREIIGNINVVTPHPSNPNVMYVGAGNGGIWKTNNAVSDHPHWIPLSDHLPSLSIGALEFDPLDASNQTLVAGVRSSSSFFGLNGGRVGLYRTMNGGTDWQQINPGGVLSGVNINGIAPRGNIITIATNSGIQRSVNTGVSWIQISGVLGTGLPAGISFDLVSDPNNPNILYTNAGSNGIYRSNDAGATWTIVSNAAMNAIISSGSLGNIEITVGNSNNLFAAVLSEGFMTGLFRSGNGGNTWAVLDLPGTMEATGFIGTHTGSRNDLLSIAADPRDSNIVYIGGVTQRPPWPNSIGANNWTGRLFRVDASRPLGFQSAHLTHSNTASNSSPHADSRDMKFAANGRLIEVSDGGIYYRTRPLSNVGDWHSMIGDIQTTELHSIAWDSNSDIIIGGAQDNGTPVQTLPFNTRWRNVSGGDGGDVAVDDWGTPGLSTRYSSSQNLGGLRRRTYDGLNNLIASTPPSLTVLFGGNDLVGQFVTPIELNSVDPDRMVIGAANSIYESWDQGDVLIEIGPGLTVNGRGRHPIAYGIEGNADIIYAGVGDELYVRLSRFPSPLVVAPSFPGGTIADIAIKQDDAFTAFVIDETNVYQTTDAGESWSLITRNLPSFSPGTLRSLTYCTSYINGGIVVGTDEGVFIAYGPNFTFWSEIEGIPNVPVFDLEYDDKDQILVAATMGRGAWTIGMERNFEFAAKIVCGTQADSNRLSLVRGIYGTEINIHNPNQESTSFFKKLALSYPPGSQRPGSVFPIGIDVLGPDEALAADCDDLRERLFPDGLPQGVEYFTGFLVLQPTHPLDVTAVYTSGTIDHEGHMGPHSSIDVEQVQGRRIINPKRPIPRPRPDSLPDLVPLMELHDHFPSFCWAHPNGFLGRGIRVVVRNQGLATSPPTVTCVSSMDGSNVCLNTPSLAPGSEVTLVFPMPESACEAGPGGGELWCSFTITVNNGMLPESNFNNNSVEGVCGGPG